MYLPDTNTLSEPFKQIPNQNVLRKLKQHDEQLFLAITVWHELQYGFHLMPEGKRKRDLYSYHHEHIIKLPLLIYDKNCAEIHAKIRAIYYRKGRTLGLNDSQIASIALAHDLIVVTRNVSDFELIDGLKFVNWFE